MIETPKEKKIRLRKRANETQRQWRLDNPEKFAAQKVRWQANQKQRQQISNSGSWSKKRDTETGLEYIKRIWAKIKNKKESSGYEFSVQFSDINWIPFCPILGLTLDYSGQDYNAGYSLDRLDNSKGYIVGNVYVLSRRANRIKNEGTASEHIKIAEWMRQLSQLS